MRRFKCIKLCSGSTVAVTQLSCMSPSCLVILFIHSFIWLDLKLGEQVIWNVPIWSVFPALQMGNENIPVILFLICIVQSICSTLVSFMCVYCLPRRAGGQHSTSQSVHLWWKQLNSITQMVSSGPWPQPICFLTLYHETHSHFGLKPHCGCDSEALWLISIFVCAGYAAEKSINGRITGVWGVFKYRQQASCLHVNVSLYFYLVPDSEQDKNSNLLCYK